MIKSYWHDSASNTRQFHPSILLPLLNSGNLIFRIPTDSEESNVPEAVFVVCFCLDFEGTAPRGNALLLIRLPLLPPSNSITKGRGL